MSVENLGDMPIGSAGLTSGSTVTVCVMQDVGRERERERGGGEMVKKGGGA